MDTTTDIKTCTKCGDTKPIDQFYTRADCKNRSSKCMPCYRQQQNESRRIRLRTRRKNSIYKAKEFFYENNTPRGRARQLRRDIKKRSKAKGYEFSLSLDWLTERIKSGCCKTGISFVLCRDGNNVAHPFAPSVDRIDGKRGYTEDNCQVVVWIYNAAKNSFDERYVIEFAKRLLEKNELSTKSSP